MRKRKIRADDLLKMKFIRSVCLSPDESQVMFTVEVMSDDKKKYFAHIYLITVDGTNLRQYTFGEVSDSRPLFSPDGKWIVFTSKRGEKKGIYKMPTSGGEAKLVVKAEGFFSELSISPDSKRIACVLHKADDVPKDKDGKKEQPVYRHITRMFYKYDGMGFLPKDRGHIYVYDLETGKGIQITKGKIGERAPVWFPDGKNIAYVTNFPRDRHKEPSRNEVFMVSVDGGKAHKLNKPSGPVSSLSVSPNGKEIVGVAHDNPNETTTNTHIWKIPVKGGKVVDLIPELDRTALNLTISDMGELSVVFEPIWSKDGKEIYFQVSDAGATHLCKVSATGGRVKRVIGGKIHLLSASLAGKTKVIASTISTPTMPAEIFISTTTGKNKPKQITHLNSTLLKSVHIQKPEETIVRGDDGYPIHGWILKPPNFSPKKKYPSILQIHGGPGVQYGYTFFHEMQFLAARGYVVYYCNPRGGQGYGQKHAEYIVNNWGGVDYDDCMSFTCHMAKRKYIDERRMGVTGGSYGGYMTNWVVSHTNLFSAAVTQRSITNFISDFGSSCGGFMLGRQIGGSPWKNHDSWWQMSPLKHVEKIKTSLLIIHSERDLITCLEQAEQLFIFLKKLKRKVEMVIFPEESHGLSRHGRPDRRVARLEWIAKWFDRHLKARK